MSGPHETPIGGGQVAVEAPRFNSTTARLLVCGGRDYTDRETLFAVLDGLHHKHRFGYLIHGNSRGADRLADEWGRFRVWEYYPSLHIIPVSAQWSKFGKGAGPKRNQQMLGHLHPATGLVVAFSGGRGTADMVKRARAAGIPVLEPLAVLPKAEEPRSDASQAEEGH